MGKNKLLFDLDAEKAVLSACLNDPDAAAGAVGRITAGDFMRIAHQRIFEAISSLVEAGSAVDAITVAHRLAADGLLEEARGRKYLLDLTDDRISLVAWRDHVRIVGEYSVQRKIARAAVCVVEESCRPQADFEAYLEYVVKTMSDAVCGVGRKE